MVYEMEKMKDQIEHLVQEFGWLVKVIKYLFCFFKHFLFPFVHYNKILFLAWQVMYDAFGVRLHAGRQAEVFKSLMLSQPLCLAIVYYFQLP
jgi:Divergent PAP2 family